MQSEIVQISLGQSERIMKSTFFNDVDAFAQAAAFLTASREAEMMNNIIVSLIPRIRSGEYPDPSMLIVRDRGAAVFAALMTPPHNLHVSSGPPSAASIIVESLVARGIAVPGCAGIGESADAFASAWTTKTQGTVTTRKELTFYAATDIIRPTPVPGRARLADASDHALLMRWLEQFAVDSGLAMRERKKNPEALSNQIAAGQFFMWEHENRTPLSVARWIPITDYGVRIGSVYTPKELRRNGYASACVAHLTQWLLSHGRTWCSLFADVANPQANAIYRRIGYRPRFSHREYRF
jgi:uncharacterized protein